MSNARKLMKLSPEHYAETLTKPAPNSMLDAFKYRCPTFFKLPEPPRVVYQEELRDRGYLYVQVIAVFGRRHAIGKRIVTNIDKESAMQLRGAVRAQLIRKFWRSLGAA